MYSYGPPHMAEQKQDSHLEHTYSSSVRIQDVALKTCQKQWTVGRNGERGSGISMLAARHDDDDFNHYAWGRGDTPTHQKNHLLIKIVEYYLFFFFFFPFGRVYNLNINAPQDINSLFIMIFFFWYNKRFSKKCSKFPFLIM